MATPGHAPAGGEIPEGVALCSYVESPGDGSVLIRHLAEPGAVSPGPGESWSSSPLSGSKPRLGHRLAEVLERRFSCAMPVVISLGAEPFNPSDWCPQEPDATALDVDGQQEHQTADC